MSIYCNKSQEFDLFALNPIWHGEDTTFHSSSFLDQIFSAEYSQKFPNFLGSERWHHLVWHHHLRDFFWWDRSAKNYISFFLKSVCLFWGKDSKEKETNFWRNGSLKTLIRKLITNGLSIWLIWQSSKLIESYKNVSKWR